jgi:hypothetical protein
VGALNRTDKWLWRTLCKNDRVRIVHLPNEFSGPEYTLHPDTSAAYRHVIDSREVLTVSHVDEDGYPWVDFTMIAGDGVTHYHSLMLNHDGIERVESD